MLRRQFLAATTASAAAATLAAPNIVRAQESFTWRMTNAYGPGAPFYTTGPGSPSDFAERVATMSGGRLTLQPSAAGPPDPGPPGFAERVATMSGGRLTLQHFAAGELIPALEGFDAVAASTVETNAANSYFWSGKTFAAQYFTTVPFGMSFQGHMAWLYHGGGLELWREVYEPFGVVPFPLNNTGVQMTGWFRKPIESV